MVLETHVTSLVTTLKTAAYPILIWTFYGSTECYRFRKKVWLTTIYHFYIYMTAILNEFWNNQKRSDIRTMCRFKGHANSRARISVEKWETESKEERSQMSTKVTHSPMANFFSAAVTVKMTIMSSLISRIYYQLTR